MGKTVLPWQQKRCWHRTVTRWTS